MQTIIGPPIHIPAHLIMHGSEWVRITALAVVAVSLLAHVVFLVWVFRFLRQWRKEIDEQRRQREERERRLSEQEREGQQRIQAQHGATARSLPQSAQPTST